MDGTDRMRRHDSFGSSASETTDDNSKRGDDNGIARAVEIVRDLWTQITERDAPAGNEGRPLQPQPQPKEPVDAPTRVTLALSESGPPDVTPSLAASSYDTDLMSLYTTPLATEDHSREANVACTMTTHSTWSATTLDSAHRGATLQTRHQEQWTETEALLQSPSVTKLGQGPLAALCRSVWHPWDVQQLHAHEGTAPLLQLNIQSPESPPLAMAPSDEEENRQTCALPTCSPRVGRGWGSSHGAPSRPKMASRWYPKSSTPRKPNQCAPVGSFPSSDEEEKKQDDRADPPRLQQFGSEYARHLSHSQLAPSRYNTMGGNHHVGLSSGRFFKPSRRVGNMRPAPCRNLEQAPADVQSGALLDICLTPWEDPPPAGYYRLSHTASGHEIPTVTSKKNSGYRWNVKKEPVWDKAAQRPCVTAVTLMYPDRDEFVPPGFTVVRLVRGPFHTHGSHEPVDPPPANLNAGLPHSERVYLCLRRSREGNPITGLVPLIPTLGETVPTGYTVVERTPRNHPACIAVPPTTTGASSTAKTYMFLAIRQRLANLETLRPSSLMQTLPPGEPRLRAYYATGGTVVRSDVGRFHIMDRSTHSLLSPSSVANRFKVIEAARRRDRDGDGLVSSESHHSTTTYARSECESVGSFVSMTSSMGSSSFPPPPPTRSTSLMDFPIREAVTEDVNDYDSECYTKENANPLDDEATANLSSLLAPLTEHKQKPFQERSTQTGNVSTLVSHQHAMSFIPQIEAPLVYENGLDRLDSRKLILTPILTACYSRHGGSAFLAVEGLHSLLTETDFFVDDVDVLEEGRSHADSTRPASSRLTLLDLAIQAVCDVATSGSQEILFPSCVGFVSHAVSFSQGQLNTRTIGFVARFHMFVFYFDASSPRSNFPRWPSPSWRPPEMHDEEDFPMLYDPRADDGSHTYTRGDGHFSGGAPQAAALALKELVSFSIVRLGHVAIAESANVEMQTTAKSNASVSGDNSICKHVYESLMDSIVSSLVDDAVDCVERANYTQLALHQIHRSGGSELFWNDMTLFCGRGLFAKDQKLGEAGNNVYALNFAILQHFVKASSGKLRSKPENPETLPRDVASKLLSLELLLHFLEFWSDEQEALNGASVVHGAFGSGKSIETMAFAIRRTVVPCLLWNTRAGFESPQVFRRIIRIISELWSSPVYRRHCKIELGVLIEHFALKIIELGPQCFVAPVTGDKGWTSLLLQQIELIREIKNWFCGDPKDVIELYLNYDTDISSEPTAQSLLLPGTRWQIFQRLSAGISSIAEQCGERIGNQIRLNQSIVLSQADKAGGPKADSAVPKELVKRGAADSREIREASRVLRKVSLDAVAQIVKNLAVSAGAVSGEPFTALFMSWSQFELSTVYTSNDSEFGTLLRPPSEENSYTDVASTVKGGEGVLQFWTKAILQDKKLRAAASIPTTKESLDTAFDIAQQKGMKKAIEYLIACNSLSPAPRDIANFLRIHKDRFDPTALGQYLCGSGSSGTEAEYWNSIRQLFVRSTSFIGMHVEEGLRHFLSTSGFRLPGEAQQIDRIICTFAQCFFEDNAGDIYHCPLKNQDTVYLLVFAIIMLNTDLHKADYASRKTPKRMTKSDFTNNFRAAVQGEIVSKEYLSTIYDSIAANPIAMHEISGSTSTEESRSLSINKIFDNVRTSDSLLRGLAVHDFAFITINDFTETLNSTAKHALSDLTCSCVSKTWHQWHGLVNTCLDTAHLDPQGMEPAVDILLYALVVTVCLDMPMERSAFLSQLVRLRAFEERRQGRWVSAPDNGHREEQWYLQLENSCAGLSSDKLLALRQIYGWVQSLKAALRVDVRNKVEMTEAVAELVDGDYLLDDPARSFLQSENLTKKSSRTGRSTIYRFYLFSDLLLYASKEPDGRYKIHEELPLHLMKIVDWFPPFQKNRKIVFEVHHPSKTFQVLCHSSDVKKSWVENIRASILVEMERKMTTEAARLSASTTKSTCVNVPERI